MGKAAQRKKERGTTSTKQSESSEPPQVAKNGDYNLCRAPVKIVSSLELAFVLSLVITTATYVKDSLWMLMDAMYSTYPDERPYSVMATLDMFYMDKLNSPWVLAFLALLHIRGCYMLFATAYMYSKYHECKTHDTGCTFLKTIVMPTSTVLMLVSAHWLYLTTTRAWQSLLYTFDIVCIVSFMMRIVYDRCDNNVLHTLLAPISVKKAAEKLELQKRVRVMPTSTAASAASTDAPKQSRPTTNVLFAFDEGVFIISLFTFWMQSQLMSLIMDLALASYHLSAIPYSALECITDPRVLLLFALCIVALYPWKLHNICVAGVSLQVFLLVFSVGAIIACATITRPYDIANADSYRIEELYEQMKLHEDPWASEFSSCGWFVYDNWKPLKVIMLDDDPLLVRQWNHKRPITPGTVHVVRFPHDIFLNKQSFMHYSDYTTVLLNYFQQQSEQQYNGTDNTPFIIVRMACYFPRMNLQPYGVLNVMINNTLHYEVDTGQYDGIEHVGARHAL